MILALANHPWLLDRFAEQLGERRGLQLQRRHLLGEMVEQPGVMGEREDDGDGEAVGGGSGRAPLLPA